MVAEITKHHGHHFLWIDDECWMWDLRTERRAQADLARRAHGDVLVVGYGLGLVQKCLLVNRNVTSVLTIELYPEVLIECERVFGELYGMTLVGDFFGTFEVNRIHDRTGYRITTHTTEGSSMDFDRDLTIKIERLSLKDLDHITKHGDTLKKSAYISEDDSRLAAVGSYNDYGSALTWGKVRCPVEKTCHKHRDKREYAALPPTPTYY